MPKSSVETYSLIELSSDSKGPSNNNNQMNKNTESSSSENGSSGRVRFLEPHTANHSKPSLSKIPPNGPSVESFEGSSFENLTDLQQDGPNSVSRGLQTDISSSSVIDWVLAQKSSMTGERYSNLIHRVI